MITGMPRIAIAVRDFQAVVSLFRDTLGMPVIDISDSSVDSLGARLAMCVPPGGSNIELMCPAVPGAPLAGSLTRFLDRRGEGLFALMLEAEVPDDEAEALAGNGLAVLPLMAGAAGRDIHPRSTHGVLIRVYPTHSFQGSLEQGDKDIGLSGIRRVLVAVNDVNQARETYGRKLGLQVSPAVEDGTHGTISVSVKPPSGGEIELVAVAEPDNPLTAGIARQLTETGEGMFALVLQSDDLMRTGELLKQRGAVFTGDTWLELAPEMTFGARLLIEQG